MAFKFKDRVKDTTTTTGTGTVTLDNTSSTGFRTFASALAVSDTAPYCIQDSVAGAWEVGFGTLVTSTTFSRDTVTASSNANALVSFVAGAKDIFITDIATVIVPPLASTTAPSGTVQIGSKAIANRTLLSQVNLNTVENVVQPFLGRGRVALWNAPGSSTGVPGTFGMFPPTLSGTLARPTTTTNVATRMRRTGFPTIATAGTVASVYSTVGQYTAGSGTAGDGSGFHYVCRFVPANTAAVAGERFFCGISSSVAAPTNVDPSTLTNSIGVAQLSTNSTQLYLVYGGSAAQTAIALNGSDFPAGTFGTTAFEISIYAPSNTANTYHVQVTNINTGATYNTTLSGAATVVPQSTTLLNWRIWKTNNTTNVLAAFDLGQVYVETDA